MRHSPLPSIEIMSKKMVQKKLILYPVEVMGKSAEFCANYVSKGRLFAIQVSIRVDRYQTQTGENRTFTKVSSRTVQALESNKNRSENSYGEGHQGSQPTFEPNFETPQGLDPNGFQAIDDDDIPF